MTFAFGVVRRAHYAVKQCVCVCVSRVIKEPENNEEYASGSRERTLMAEGDRTDEKRKNVIVCIEKVIHWV